MLFSPVYDIQQLKANIIIRNVQIRRQYRYAVSWSQNGKDASNVWYVPFVAMIPTTLYESPQFSERGLYAEEEAAEERRV